MKKLFASAGLVVFGAASMQAAYAPGLSGVDTSKPWSVSATLRGFYDDNYTTLPSNERDSFGIEVRPSVAVNLPLEQTYLGARYIYSMKWYEDRDKNSADHTHQFEGIFNHAFSERYTLDIFDSFVIAQEPELIDTVGGISVPFRTEGDNIRNRASINFGAQLTTLLGLDVGYENTLYDYEQDDGDVTVGATSRSGLLDRKEHLVRFDLRWQALQNTVGIFGYQFGYNDYTGDEVLDPLPGGTGTIMSDSKDSRSHYFYVGADHNFRPDLSGSVRIGAQYIDFFKDNRSNWGPYADASMTYQYGRGSHLVGGVRHSRYATDVALASDQEATTLYAELQHRITPRLTGSLLGTLQHSEFEGGTFDGESEKIYLVGLNFNYRFNQYLSGEVGYNYDHLDSDLAGRGYSRNRVYIGVTAKY